MNSVVELAQAFDTMALTKHKKSVSAYWAEIFQCDDGSPDLFVAVAALQAKLLKVIQVLAAADMSDRSKGLYIQAATALQPFVTSHQIAQLSTSQIAGLRQNIDVLFLAGEVYPKEAAPVINPITLDTLEQELSELIEEVCKSEMPMQLRYSVEAQLRTLLLAVRGYDILGQEGFARAYGSAAAGLTQAAQATPPTDAASVSMYKKALGFCQKAGTAIVWASATMGGVHGILESGTAIGGLIGILPTDGAEPATPKAK